MHCHGQNEVPVPDGRPVILIGNPNVGKSAIFGALTGRYVEVSNYPGTTVELARGKIALDGVEAALIDTPGVVNPLPRSDDERVTRDVLLNESPWAVVQVTDAKNLRRALALTFQLAEHDVPFVLDLNMADEAEALALPEDRPLRVIDVGGGHGAYSLALARRYPNLTATVFELPRVVPVAREIIAGEGLDGRVYVQEGNFQTDDLGSGYDVALLFGVMVGEAPERRAALIRKVFAALNPGGRIVVREFMLDPDRAGPPEAALFALQMLLATDSGGLSTTEELARWFSEAGFGPPQVLPLPSWPPTVAPTAKPTALPSGGPPLRSCGR